MGSSAPGRWAALCVLVGAGALTWVKVAFDGVHLDYGPYGSCRQLTPSTVSQLWAAGTAPLVVLALSIVASATTAAWAHAQRSHSLVTPTAVVLVLSAAIGAYASFVLYAPGRETSGVALLWILIGPLLTLFALIVVGVDRAGRGRQRAGIAGTIALLTMAYLLLVPLLVAELTPTASDTLCMS